MSAPASVTRQLRAIAVMDVAGYSRHMERDEAGTHARLNRLIGSVVAPVIQSAHGRIVDRAGDGLLVEFHSSTDAVRCGVEIQRRMAAEKADAAAAEPFELRIGINLGDIIVDGDRIVGDDVNIAARLQGIAVPGGICISAAVHDQLHDKLGIPISDIGHVALKNIARPVHAFHIWPPGRTRARRLAGVWRLRMRWTASRWQVHAMVVVGFAVIARLVFIAVEDRWTAPAMSVAIMPFVGDGGVEAQAVIAVTNEVTRGMASTKWIRVTPADVAARSAATLAHDLEALGRQLNVRYVVYGQVDQHGDTLVISAQLVDAGRKTTVWTTEIDAKEPHVSGVDLARRLVVPLRQALYDVEAARFIGSGARPSTAMEYTLLGDRATDSPRFMTLQASRTARSYFERALQANPEYMPAMISLGYTLVTELDLDPAVDRERVLQKIGDLSSQIVMMDAAAAPSWQFRAEALARQWQWDAALEASRTAAALDAGRSHALSQRASLLVVLGRPAEALRFVDQALSLPDQRVGYAHLQRCRAHMALGQYQEAVSACQKAVAREDVWMAHAYLAAGYALIGEQDNANVERAALLQAYPGLTVARLRAIGYSNVPLYQQQVENHLYRGLRMAGIAEG